MKLRIQLLLLSLVIFVPVSFAGEIVCWGWGGSNGEITNAPAGDDFIGIAAGFSHSAALRANGSVEVWGQLWGDDSTGNSDVFNVPQGYFTQIASGHSHCLALSSDGSLSAWGINNSGQCDVPSGNDFIAIACGEEHSLALRPDGSVVAWGSNIAGQCDVPQGYQFEKIISGCIAYHSLGVTNQGQLIGWGDNSFNQLDFFNVNNVKNASAGEATTTVLYNDGELDVWGSSSTGQFAIPDGVKFTDISSSRHSLALDGNGYAYAWGIDPLERGIIDVPMGHQFSSISAGAFHCVALTPEPGSILLMAIGAVAVNRKNR